MTNADLQKIETSLNVKLPAFYWDLMLQHGDEIRETDKFMHEHVGEAVIHPGPDEVIEDTKNCREGAFAVLDGNNLKQWPPSMVAVGNNGASDHWFIFIDGRSSGMWFAENCGRIDECYPSMKAYLEHLRAEKKSYEELDRLSGEG
jgi:hypothetical protein